MERFAARKEEWVLDPHTCLEEGVAHCCVTGKQMDME